MGNSSRAILSSRTRMSVRSSGHDALHGQQGQVQRARNIRLDRAARGDLGQQLRVAVDVHDGWVMMSWLPVEARLEVCQDSCPDSGLEGLH